MWFPGDISSALRLHKQMYLLILDLYNLRVLLHKVCETFWPLVTAPAILNMCVISRDLPLRQLEKLSQKNYFPSVFFNLFSALLFFPF